MTLKCSEHIPDFMSYYGEVAILLTKRKGMAEENIVTAFISIDV